MKQHVIIGMPEAAWQGVDQDKINAAFMKFTGAEQGVAFVRWRRKVDHTKIWLIACYWTQHLLSKVDSISQDKIDALKAKLDNLQIRIEFSDNPQGDLDALGLEPDCDEEPI